MTTVPLTGADMALYRPMMAMDQAMPGAKFGGYGSGDDDPNDINETDNEGYDVENKVRTLLEGKLDPADLDALCDLIFPDDDAAPAPALDRKRQRQAHDRRPAMPTRQQMERLVAEGAARRAERAIRNHADLIKRWPALATARVA